MVNVIDGRADIQIDTSNLQEGEYKIQTIYTDGNYYTDTSVENSTLTLEPQTWTRIADLTTTSTEWTKTPQSDGIHSTLNTYESWKIAIPNHSTIRITGVLNSTQAGIELRNLYTGNTSSLSWNCHDGINKWGRIGSGRLANLTWNTGDFVLEITNNNGVFDYTLNGVAGSVNINSDQLNTCYLAFYVINGEMILRDVRYKSVSTGGGVTSQILSSTSLNSGVCA